MMLLNNKKIYIKTLGCRVNIFESNQFANELIKKGAIITKNFNDAEIIIINTCSVTNNADAKSRYFINKANNSKNCKIVCVCGCYSQTNDVKYGEKIKIVIGNKYKNKLIDFLINENYCVKKDNLKNENELEKFYDNFSFPLNTRAFIKIQDGCNFNCSYCSIPETRGRQRSLDNKIIIEEIEKLITDNIKEIILTGVNTAGYNYKGISFYDLLCQINKLKGEFRVRISSIEPFQIDDKIINLVCNNERFCQFFHLCLQNANNNILSSMNRKYKIEEFINLITKIRNKNNLISISTDYIVGYPLETETIFEENLKTLDSLNFCDMHIFKYSDRKNTVASTLKKLNNQKEINIWQKKITELNNINKKRYLMQFIGKTVNVIFENKFNKNFNFGHSEFFFTVKVETNINLSNQLKKVKITDFINDELYGCII